MRFTFARVAPLIVLLLSGGLVSGPARADQAREAVGLFVQSCLKYVEDPAGLLDWIATVPQLRHFSPEEARDFLGGQRGDVWNADNDAGLFALVVYADDTCSVIAQQASADQVSLVFSEYVRRKSLPLDKISDRKDFVRGIDTREETYRTHSGGLPYEVVLITSKSLRAEAQAILTTRPNR